MMNYLSDAIALNFLLLMYEDWKRKGSPIGNDIKAKQFQKNSFILLDSLIYEYVTQKWRGSSDSRIAGNINSLKTTDDVLTPLSKQKWKDLIDEIINDNKIDGNPITLKLMQPILYHFYSISKIQGPDSNFAIEVDHIIPQSTFKSSATPDKDIVVHNLFNLGLLPKDENISKGNKPLNAITNKWLIDQIVKYEFIDETDFRKYSDLGYLNDLKDFRAKKFIGAFDVKRDQILNN